MLQPAETTPVVPKSDEHAPTWAVCSPVAGQSRRLFGKNSNQYARLLALSGVLPRGTRLPGDSGHAAARRGMGDKAIQGE